MVKKKRLVLAGCLAALGGIFSYFGLAVGALIFLLFVGGLGVVYAKDLFLSRQGLTKLEALQPHYGNDACIAKVRASPQQEGEFKFVVLGDSRKRLKMALQVFDEAKKERPATIFHTGDIVVGGTPAEFLSSYVPLLDLANPIPVLSVPGNHERGAWRNFAAYRALCGGDRFAFEAGGCAFIGLNNSTHTRITEDDLAYLDASLRRSQAQQRFVFIHIPPAFFEAEVVNDSHRRGFVENAQAFHKLLIKHNVEEVFMAHIHGYASAKIDGIHYTITAGAGAALSKRMPEFGRYHHYLVREIKGGVIRREIVRFIEGRWERAEG